MKKFYVWIEGFAATGESQTAQFLGSFEGETFINACKKAMVEKEWDMSCYDENKNTYWACQFFDNEKEARASFG